MTPVYMITVQIIEYSSIVYYEVNLADTNSIGSLRTFDNSEKIINMST